MCFSPWHLPENHSAAFTRCSRWAFHSHGARRCWCKWMHHPRSFANTHQWRIQLFAFPLTGIQEKLSLSHWGHKRAIVFFFFLTPEKGNLMICWNSHSSWWKFTSHIYAWKGDSREASVCAFRVLLTPARSKQLHLKVKMFRRKCDAP